MFLLKIFVKNFREKFLWKIFVLNYIICIRGKYIVCLIFVLFDKHKNFLTTKISQITVQCTWGDRIESGGRFIENEDVQIANACHSNRQPTMHSHGKIPALSLASIIQVHLPPNYARESHLKVLCFFLEVVKHWTRQCLICLRTRLTTDISLFHRTPLSLA